MAAIYRDAPSRFGFGQTHYTTNAEAVLAQQQMHMQLRYNAYSVDGHNVPLPRTPPTPQRHGASVGSPLRLATPPPPPPPTSAPPAPNAMNKTSAYAAALRQQQQNQQYSSMGSPIYNGGMSSLYMNPMLTKTYQQMQMAQHQVDLLLVSPGMPTPVELSIYENKQPTGFLHVTVGNQTVEFLDGVANMPKRRIMA